MAGDPASASSVEEDLYKDQHVTCYPASANTLDGGSDKYCEDCFYSNIITVPSCNTCVTVRQDLRKFMEYQEVGLDQGYKCPRCRACKDCKRGAGYEKISMKQEAEQEVIKSSVFLDEQKNRAVVKLAFIADPIENLKPNRYVALKRLNNVCRKYANEPEAVQMICDKVAKLHNLGHIKFWEDLSADQKQRIEKSPTNHYLCWDVGFKEDSLSTPARPVFDASARTPGGTSLNDLLAKGITTLARLVEVQLTWVMGRFAVTGDVSQAYNAMLLDVEHWVYQRILLKDNLKMNSDAREAVITSAIYGVRCVGGQLEVLCGILADMCEDEFPMVAELLRKFRYVDDFAKSLDSLNELFKLIKDTEKVLAKASLVVKDWAWTGKDPPEKMSSDGLSVCLAGLVWYTKIDTYRLNLDSLHFAVKKRGRYPPGTVKLEDTNKSVDEFVPEKLTRRSCARVAARVYDLRGDVAPLLLRLKYDLRGLIHKKYDWDDVLDMESRKRWVDNFTMMEQIRQFMFTRCPIPRDAIKKKGRLWILVDAADGGLILAAYMCFLRKGGIYSCQRVFGKGLLCPELWTIPARELQALATGADIVTFLGNILSEWLETDEIYVGSDSRIALAWVAYEKVKLDVYYRNRVSQIRSQVSMSRLFHVDGKQNIADIGTRPDDLKIKDFCPGSEWEKGKPWMNLEVDEAKKQGIIKPVEMIKLEDEDKKVFKKGITYDDFSLNPMIIAFSVNSKMDKVKIQERLEFSEYLYNPLLRSFRSLVRITALVLKAVKIFKKRRTMKLIKDGKLSVEALDEFDISPVRFTVFSNQPALVEGDLDQGHDVSHHPTSANSVLEASQAKDDEGKSEVSNAKDPAAVCRPTSLHDPEDDSKKDQNVAHQPASANYVEKAPKICYHCGYTFCRCQQRKCWKSHKQDMKACPTVSGQREPWIYHMGPLAGPGNYLNLSTLFLSNCRRLRDMGIVLTEEDLSTALTYLYTKATKEIYKFVPRKTVQKEGIEYEGILYAKTRILEGQELRVMGELDEMLDLESFTGVKFRVPLLEKHSPLAICIAFHIHYNVAPHRGSESVYRISLQHAKVINGKSLYLAVENDCIRCKILKKRYLEQMMGPLADSQLSISPVFYCSLLDLWGPVRTYCPGYERTGYTRGSVSHAKHYEVHFMVVACVVTGAVNLQVVEKKDTGAILDGLSRFFNECCVPKVMLPDADGALMEALREGVIELSNLEGTLAVEYGIQFEPCMPQGHWEHGRVERRIRMLQESLDRSGLKGTRCHATGLQTIAKAIERQVNDVPLGLLEQSTRGGNVLRILTPNMLKMNTRTNRSPKGLLTIPNHASDLIKNVEKGFNLWYQVWNDVYLPMAAEYKKWHNQAENLCVGDIVLFKLKDSVFASNWKIGKVDSVDVGRDGLVRGVYISYKAVDVGKEDARHTVIQRPVKQVVKLFHINDTTLLSDITKVKQITEKIIKKKNMQDDDIIIDPQNSPTQKETDEQMKPDVKIESEVQDASFDDTNEEQFEIKQEIKIEEEDLYQDPEEVRRPTSTNSPEEDLYQDSDEVRRPTSTNSPEEDLYQDPEEVRRPTSTNSPEEDLHQDSDEVRRPTSTNSPEEDSYQDTDESRRPASNDSSEGDSNHEDDDQDIDDFTPPEEDQKLETLDKDESKGNDIKTRKKSELEKLLIENEKFWKDFDERKKRGTISYSPFWMTDDQMNKFHSMQVDSGVDSFTTDNYEVGNIVGDEEGAVFLL